jgi:arylsulfatase A
MGKRFPSLFTVNIIINIISKNSYMVIIGNIVNELKAQGIAENTLLIFVGDNGTNLNIVSNTNNGPVKGAKGNTITHGNHVPMVASWPASVKKPKSYNGLINFSDFYATFAAILNVDKDNSDGVSFEDTLTEGEELNRETATIYYDPMWGKNSGFRKVFSQTDRYKLYKSGKFYDMKNDLLEKKSLKDTELSESQLLIKEKLQINLDQYPDLPKEKPTLKIK